MCFRQKLPHGIACIRRRPLLLALLPTAVLSVLFLLFPAIDRLASHLFFVPGRGFPAARISTLQDFRVFASNLSLAVPLVLASALCLKLAFPARTSLLPPRLSLYMVSLYLAGPVVLVNGLLKPFWGRPRPVNVAEFGGSSAFQPAWVIGPQGLANHSFASGEAAATACLLPLLLFLPRPWRGPVGTLLAGFLALVGLNRLAFGAHFLSDVVLSIGLMLVLAAGLHHLFFIRGRHILSDAALEARLTALGQRGACCRARLRRRLGDRLVAARRGVWSVFGG